MRAAKAHFQTKATAYHNRINCHQLWVMAPTFWQASSTIGGPRVARSLSGNTEHYQSTSSPNGAAARYVRYVFRGVSGWVGGTGRRRCDDNDATKQTHKDDDDYTNDRHNQQPRP